jgi:hypothetical protein
MIKPRIKVVSLPARCEVCHQSDCFDPIKNHCSRCADIVSIKDSYIERTHKRVELPVSEYIGIVNILRFMLIVFITTSWGASIGCAAGGLIKLNFKNELIALLCILFGSIVGLVWGTLIGYRAITDRYRALHENSV